MDNFITREENDFKNIFNRFKKRDFSGDSGQAIKNSSYQLATNIVMKVGSLLFTIIIARLLLPELFGLYSLALATILFFSAFSDFGISTSLMTFVSKSLGNNDPGKAKAYFKKLLKWKFYLIIISSVALLASSYFIANNYYQKPIFFALLAGCLYIPATSLMNLMEQLFKSNNNFKSPLLKEIVFQILRLTILPLGIFMLLKTSLTDQILTSSIILLLVLCYLVALFLLLIFANKKINFLKSKSFELTPLEISGLRRFILPLTVTILSGIFFGYIDTLMLGHFVTVEYIAYYGIAFGLIGSAVAIIGFISTAVFPLFSRLQGKSLQSLFKKARNVTFLISFLAGIFTYFAAWWIIRLAYGTEYLVAVPILKWFAILVLILPVIGIYSIYLTSQKKTKMLAWIIVFTTILNIVLNLFGIKFGLNHGFFGPPGMFQAVLGATFATIISRVVYIGGLIVFRNK